VRGLQRQQEYAVRTALGVRRIELFRQVSIENLLLAPDSDFMRYFNDAAGKPAASAPR